jgi:hypothetical protein
MVQASVVDSQLRGAAIRAMAAIHTKETLPFLATLLRSGDSGEQFQAVYGLGAFANGCPMNTRDNVVSMAYLQCDETSVYKTADTVANFAFRPAAPQQGSSLLSSTSSSTLVSPTLVSFWQEWWRSHAELH